MTLWTRVGIEGYEGKPYTFLIPPSDPALGIAPPSAENVAQIIHYDTGYSDYMKPAQDIVVLTQPVKSQELNPQFIMAYSAAAQTYFEKSTMQLGIAISPSFARHISPDLPLLQNEDAILQAAASNEFGNAISLAMSTVCRAC